MASSTGPGATAAQASPASPADPSVSATDPTSNDDTATESARRQLAAAALSEPAPDTGRTAAAAAAAATTTTAPILPKAGERNVLVTSALPYVNNVPHLGNLIGAVLSADVYARYLRQTGVNVLFVCGTDEYGTATETKAAEENLSPRELCDKYYRLHCGVYDWFDCRFDHFGRTSTPAQTAICQEIFWHIYNNGFCVEDTVDQLYDAEAERFLADRYVHGECPRCGYEDAQGDQCDNCGNLLNPTELLRPRSKITGAVPEVRTSRHVFIDLPQLGDELARWVEHAGVRGGWSENALMMTRGWLRDGLKQRCITRDLKWGTPVPLDGFRDKVFYVWFDAPIGYLSITAEYAPDDGDGGGGWRRWWQNPDQVDLVRFMGKDNTPFHTVVFPSTLIATRQRWTMLHHISMTEYLNYESGKFSKRRGTGVFGDGAASTGIPAYVWRYYLLANRPEQSDSMFAWDDFAAKNNNELLNNVGNFVNRTATFLRSHFGSRVPTHTAGFDGDAERQLFADVNDSLTEYHRAAAAVSLKSALRHAMAVSRLANQYLQESKPWELMNRRRGAGASGGGGGGGGTATDENRGNGGGRRVADDGNDGNDDNDDNDDSDDARARRGGTVLAVAAGLVRLVAVMLEPFMGAAFAAAVFRQLALPHNDETNRIPQRFDADALLPPAHPLGEPALLFSKITEAQADALRARFAGEHADGSDVKQQQQQQQQQQHGGARTVATATAAPDGATLTLDLRVGRIVTCEDHPHSDRLYLIALDIGETQADTAAPSPPSPRYRQVVAGLKDVYPHAASLVDRRVVACCNLQPASLAGRQSEAMLLVAEKKNVVCLLSLDGSRADAARVPVGTRIRAGDLPLPPPPPPPSDAAYAELDRKAFQRASKPLRVGKQRHRVIFDKAHALHANGVFIAARDYDDEQSGTAAASGDGDVRSVPEGGKIK